MIFVHRTFELRRVTERVMQRTALCDLLQAHSKLSWRLSRVCCKTLDRTRSSGLAVLTDVHWWFLSKIVPSNTKISPCRLTEPNFGCTSPRLFCHLKRTLREESISSQLTAARPFFPNLPFTVLWFQACCVGNICATKRFMHLVPHCEWNALPLSRQYSSEVCSCQSGSHGGDYEDGSLLADRSGQ